MAHVPQADDLRGGVASRLRVLALRCPAMCEWDYQVTAPRTGLS